MSSSDKYLSGNPFCVNELICHELAQKISAYQPQFNTTTWGRLSKETQMTFKLAVVSICHQINWDFIQSRLAENLLIYQGKDLVKKISSVSSQEIKTWLSGYARPERIRAKERARLLRNVGKILQERWDSKSLSIFEESEGNLDGNNGFLSLLGCFAAFSEDALQKKSNVLTHELVRERIAMFTDVHNIKPAIDYHLIRLYLRTGKVTPMHRAILEQLKGSPRPRPRLVRLLRSTVSDALKITAHYAKLTIPDVNYIEWQIGRSICLNENPLCVKLRDMSEIAEDVAVLFSRGRCPYNNNCWAYKIDREWLQLQEPRYEKSYY